jgi:hypothetical protein
LGTWSLWSFGGLFADGSSKPDFTNNDKWEEGDEIKLQYIVEEGELNWWRNGEPGRTISTIHHRTTDVSESPPNRYACVELHLTFIHGNLTRLYFCVAAGNSGGCLSILGQTQDV